MRCAHNPPPCHFFIILFLLGSDFRRELYLVVPFIFLFALDLLSKNIDNKSAKKSAVRGGFFRLLDARSVIFNDFGGPGAHSGGPRRHFEDFWDYCDFGGYTGAKGDTHSDSNFNKCSTCCSDIF